MDNIGWGLQMTVLGMGLVFALLALLWLLLTLVLKLDKEPEVEVTAQEATVEAERIAAIADAAVGAQTPEPPTVKGMPADLVAAILVATHRHRQTMRRQAAPLVRSVWPGSQLFASRWLATGRARQNNNWQPRGR
ncbi:OadG family transporter subunit [Propionivibrio sp.]|uniref:OadG family transporter subunit n=1 Tax=Propionivibrio sp. TaxID=2212460 RepID=UPI00272DE752|nr:OadG family transporter subunit [Propionivibrio sp.]